MMQHPSAPSPQRPSQISAELTLARDKLFITGMAVISSDGMIASAEHTTTFNWTSPEDFNLVREEIQKSDLCVMGRVTNEIYDNRSGKRRLVLSRTQQDREAAALSEHVSPEGVGALSFLQKMCVPEAQGEKPAILVLGGGEIYSYFLGTPHLGYDQFLLTVEDKVALGKGTPLFKDFSGSTAGDSSRKCAEEFYTECLRRSGLSLKSTERLGTGTRLLRFEKCYFRDQKS